MKKERFSATEDQQTREAPREVGRGGRLSLLVMGEAGASTRALPERGEISIGRSEECDICIDDPKLSRKHLLLRIGTRVELVDLGSLNGTTVADRRLTANEPVLIAEGTLITIGSTAMMLQHSPTSIRPRRLLTHGYFEARLEEECARAAGGRTTFSTLRLRVHDKSRAGVVEELLGGWTRPTDIVGAYAPGEYEILLVDTPPAKADDLAEALTAQLKKRGLRFELGTASYPEDGRTPESLVARVGSRTQGAQEPTSSVPVGVGAMQRLDPIVKRVAGGVITVLILGETGVGKEVLARAIHQRSPRAQRPLLTINCAALSETLLESELFGHERGAFTGAGKTKEGLLETAQGGSVFLDEVGEMSLGLQAKMLRVLEQREIFRVGSTRARPIDVRFIAATNRDLENEVVHQRFRQDLFFRLNGISIVLPPLRERVDEIAPLAMAFVADSCRRANRVESLTIEPAALAFLEHYQWPGNIRELKNMIERAVLLCSGGAITFAHLPVEKMGSLLPPRLPSRMTPPFVPPTPRPPPASSFSNWDPVTQTDARAIDVPTSDAERIRIVTALEHCAGNQTQAAKLLGISRRTLVTRLATYEIPRPRKRLL